MFQWMGSWGDGSSLLSASLLPAHSGQNGSTAWPLTFNSELAEEETHREKGVKRKTETETKREKEREKRTPGLSPWQRIWLSSLSVYASHRHSFAHSLTLSLSLPNFKAQIWEMDFFSAVAMELVCEGRTWKGVIWCLLHTRGHWECNPLLCGCSVARQSASLSMLRLWWYLFIIFSSKFLSSP